jgi:hypothetical protein
MTLKELVYRVHSALDSSGVDPDKQPVDVDIDVMSEDRPEDVVFEVDTSKMPRRCRIVIE